MATDMTQTEFNAMLQIAIAQGLPGGYYMSKYSGEEIDAALDGGAQAAKAAVSGRTVTLDASELQAALDSLPRLLTESLSFNVSGTLARPVYVRNFYGPGALSIVGNNRFTMGNCIFVEYCHVPVTVHTIAFQEPEGFTSNDTLVQVSDCSALTRLESCVFTGYGTQGNAAALIATYGSAVIAASCTVKNMGIVYFSARNASVSVSAGTYSNNNTGPYVWRGGIIMLTNNAPDLLGGNASRKVGGLIVKSNGTLL